VKLILDVTGFIVGFQITVALMASNIAGSTKRAVSCATIFVLYCAGQISGMHMSDIKSGDN
jgi:hypothetical protein